MKQVLKELPKKLIAILTEELTSLPPYLAATPPHFASLHFPTPRHLHRGKTVIFILV